MKIILYLAVDAPTNSPAKRRERAYDCEFTKFQVSNKSDLQRCTSCRYGSAAELIKQIFPPRTLQNTRRCGEVHYNFGCFRVNYVSTVIKPKAG